MLGMSHTQCDIGVQTLQLIVDISFISLFLLLSFSRERGDIYVWVTQGP